MNNPVSLIGYPCGRGAQLQNCRKGPDALIKWNLAEKLIQNGIDCRWEKIIDHDDGGDDMYAVSIACQRLYEQVIEASANNRFPVTIGGDHSMAIGTWSAIADYYNAKQRLGMIWIDAHLDAHIPDTSHSGAIHGMPAACLMGYGNRKLVNLGSDGAKINPEHFVYIGIRSFETEEYNLIKNIGAHLYTINDVRKIGFDNVMTNALHIATQNTDAFGVTIDLDAFDPMRAPGVGTPVKNGLLRKEVFSALKGIGNHEKFKTIEIAEYNPNEGHDDLTKKLVLDIISSSLSSS